MNFKIETPQMLYTLRGDFAMPVGDVVKTDSGYCFECDGYRVDTVIEKHESGVFIRRDTLTNISSKPISFSSALSKFTLSGGEYEAYTQYSEWCHESVGVWNTLISEIGIGNDDIRSNTGNPPFLALYNLQNGRGVAFHLLAKSTWQMKAKKFFSQYMSQKTVDVEMGISEKGFSYTLMPKETLELPAVLYYEFKNKTDMDAYKLHRYYNSAKPAKAMPIVYDSWLANFDEISFDMMSEQLEKAKMLGIEYFTVDAGWFGKPRVWFDNVGDWQEETETSFCGRMKEFADKVRANGLKFGLWFEIERAGLSSNAYKQYPEYYLTEKGNAFVNFALPEARDYIFSKLVSNIDRYGIEYIKFDFNATLTFDSAHHSFIEYFNGYNAFIQRIRDERPQVYLENCASGGLRMSLAGLDGFDSFWISDNHSLYMQLEVFKNTLVRMPSRTLETWLTIASLEDFKPSETGNYAEKILSSGNASWSYVESVNPEFLKAVMFGGPLGISCNLCKLSDELCNILSEKFAEFKSDRDFWAKSECRILCDTETMLVLQFNDIEFKEIKIYAFAKHAMQKEVTVYPIVSDNARYSCGSESYLSVELSENGITLPVNWIERITASAAVLKKI